MVRAVPAGVDITSADMLEVPRHESLIGNFFKDKTVLITGGTGFFGKVLMAQLLLTCKGVRMIYLILRPKKGKTVQERFDELFEGPLFARLKTEAPDYADKVCCILGDCGLPDLGLSLEDQALLKSQVNVIFHAAATVRFDEHIKKATNVNVRGTRDLMRLAKDFKQLQAAVHVSTAYSYCTNDVVEERFYDSPIPYEKLINIVNTNDDETLTKMTPKIIGNWPNTYACTKAVAEDVLKDFEGVLPLAVVRPSIVVATARDPIAGWINNFYGQTGVIVGAATGLLRSLHCNPNLRSETVPVDYVINCIIAAAWDISKTSSRKYVDQIAIYNIVASDKNYLTWTEVMNYTVEVGKDCPTNIAVWHYWLTLNRHRTVHVIYSFLFHYIPAIIVDAGAVVLGKKPLLYKAYKKIDKFATVLTYFTTQEWTFHKKNTDALFKKLSAVDREIFRFDMDTIDWSEFFQVYVRGMRVYLTKDPIETIPAARKRRRILATAHYTLTAILLYGVFRLLLWLVNLFL